MKEKTTSAKRKHHLTQQQEEFLQLIFLGFNQSEAYKRIYNVEGPANHIWDKASKLLASDHMKARLLELRQMAAKKQLITLEQHLQDLLDLRNSAAQDGKWGAAITAEVARGKAGGLHIEKVEHSGGIEMKQLVAGADDLISRLRGYQK